jgi:muramoyltetrapeptide carboxypeptidase
MNTCPKKLKNGSHIRIIAPSSSMGIISETNRNIANKKLENLGLKISFGKNVEEMDDFNSSSIKSRIEDLHEAFRDKTVDAVFTVIGGFNCNQLLSYIDWKLIKKNPKIFIGFSDTTALQNAMLAKTGLITYSGPAWSTFAQKLHFDYSMEHFQKCLMQNKPFEIKPSKDWTDDAWYMDQNKRTLIKNASWRIINKGKAEGTILGANLCTFNLLQGTEYMPDIKNSILFLEDDDTSNPKLFDRDLQSLINQKNFKKVRGIVIGRFQKASRMTDVLLNQIIKSKKELNNIPVIADVDFGHTSPIITFPIGGTARIDTKKKSIVIIKH